MNQLGIDRVVFVQPLAHGTNNSTILNAVRELGQAARAVAIIDANATEGELARLAAAGVRGIRILPGGGLTFDLLEHVAARVAPLGWHIDLQLPDAAFAEFEARLRGLPTPVVVDHIGRLQQPLTLDNANLRSLLRLLETRNVWVKLSAPYYMSALGSPDYRDVALIARAFVKAAPQRMLWASNWPHFGAPAARPDERGLLATTLKWIEDDRLIPEICIRNSEVLYGFDKGSAISTPGDRLHQ